MKLQPQQLELIKAYFAAQPVLKAYLFGSFARGEAAPESDLDILVEIDYNQPVGLEFIKMQIELQSLLGRKVDLVSARGLSKYIAPIIEKEKQLIYARPIG